MKQRIIIILPIMDFGAMIFFEGTFAIFSCASRNLGASSLLESRTTLPPAKCPARPCFDNSAQTGAASNVMTVTFDVFSSHTAMCARRCSMVEGMLGERLLAEGGKSLNLRSDVAFCSCLGRLEGRNALRRQSLSTLCMYL